MSDPIWDPNLWNAGQIADQCMKLGAVVLSPKGTPRVGFSSPPPPVPDQRADEQEE